MKKLFKKLLSTNYFLLTSPRGFTLVETMIAVTLFTILMTIGSGAVLNTSSIYRKTANLRTAIDNLSFVMEDMARNLRLGSDLNCRTDLDPNCQDDISVSFTPVAGGTWVYGINPNPDQNEFYFLEKSKDGGTSFERLTSPEINIDFIKSGFEVSGVDPASGQPMVTIRISGKVIYKDLESEINLQTTVSQRLLE